MKQFDSVLLIDNDPVFTYITAELFRQSRYHFENLKTYTDSQAALEALEVMGKEDTLLIFLDVDMPLLDGWQFLEFLHVDTLNEKTEIYILSSSKNQADRERALSIGHVNDYLAKPLTLDDLKLIYDE